MIVTLVGNAPFDTDHSAQIDGSDFVIRFNRPQGLDGVSGHRFDAWAFAQSMGGKNFATERMFAALPWRNRPREIWFPRDLNLHKELRERHPHGFLKAHSELDFSEAILRQNRLSQPVRRASRAEYEKVFNRLGPAQPGDDPTMIPSTGFCALSLVLDQFQGADIRLVGFGFSGAHVHPWKREEAFVRALHRQNRLTLFETR